MRASDQILIELSELRGRLAEEHIADSSGIPHADFKREPKNEIPTQIVDAEGRYREALKKEAEEAEAQADGDFTVEGRELDRLEKRCTVGAFLSEVINGHALAGPEAEYRKELLGEDVNAGTIPLRLLAPPERRSAEHRAVTPGPSAVGRTQADILGRVFARSDAAWMGVSMPSVPTGSRLYPVLATGSTASMQSKDGTQAAVAGSFTTTTLAPVRATMSYEIRVEDVAGLMGLEEAIREDLRAGLNNLLDEQVIAGNGTAPNVSGLFNAVTQPADATQRVNHDRLLEGFYDSVDGVGAYGMSDVAALLGVDTYTYGTSLYRGGASERTALEHITEQGATFRVSSKVPAKASKDQLGLFHRKQYPMGSAVAPIWDSLQLIRDPYTLAQSGQIRITAIMLFNFALVRQGAYRLHDFQIDA